MSKKHKNKETQDEIFVARGDEREVICDEIKDDIEAYIENTKPKYAERAAKEIKEYISKKEFRFDLIDEDGDFESLYIRDQCNWYHHNRWNQEGEDDTSVTAKTVLEHIHNMYRAVTQDSAAISFILYDDEDSWIENRMASDYLNEFPERGEKYRFKDVYEDEVREAFSESNAGDEIGDLILQLVTEDELLMLAEQNPYYGKLIIDGALLDKKRVLTRQAVAELVPSNFPDMFPAARRMKRHFVLHVGPTNSGKTYHAMRALQDAGSGAYLAPLRLLAYEQYERMNSAGYPCSLLTGEEMKGSKDSPFVSSTIEMLDITAQYECVVIDEAQMIADEARGGAWTTAIIGACAKTVHVCMAAHAKNIVIALINECHDTYEVVEHQRMTPLTYQSNRDSSVDAQKGDAVIVFSRRSVHALAAEIQATGKKCSIIYGKLPYDVRHSEAEKFASGETDILVATDAIGMGMNLPIRRVVFYEGEKFDGTTRREINAAELQQIAGRAGRAGIYDEGFVDDLLDSGMHKRFRKKLNASIPDIPHANVEFPRTLASIDAPLSLTLEVWQDTDLPNLYQKESVSEMVSRCAELEELTDDKAFIYRFACINFAENNDDLHSLWLILARAELRGEPIRFNSLFIESIARNLPDSDQSLDTLENDSQKCDVFFNYCRSFNHTADMQAIEEARSKISGQIRRILNKQKFRGRKCSHCGCRLPWDHYYGMCDNCYGKMYGFRDYNDYDDDDDFDIDRLG